MTPAKPSDGETPISLAPRTLLEGTAGANDQGVAGRSTPPRPSPLHHLPTRTSVQGALASLAILFILKQMQLDSLPASWPLISLLVVAIGIGGGAGLGIARSTHFENPWLNPVYGSLSLAIAGTLVTYLLIPPTVAAQHLFPTLLTLGVAVWMADGFGRFRRAGALGLGAGNGILWALSAQAGWVATWTPALGANALIHGLLAMAFAWDDAGTDLI